MVLEDIAKKEKWEEFVAYKQGKEFVPAKEKNKLESFVKNQEYVDICTKIANETYLFSIPQKHLISKGHSGKKRTVYTFQENEMMALKLLSYLLYDYDDMFSPNLYSFRKNSSVKTAIRNISNIKNINKMYGYKVDISNYFNSIDTSLLLQNLRKDIQDQKLLSLFEKLLKSDVAEYRGELLTEQKGVMAGTPISAFLANYYIKEIDEYFWNQNVVYARYADDIILFCSKEDELKKHQQTLAKFFQKYHLSVNPDKEYFFKPTDEWEFLGFSFHEKEIDLSQNSLRKIKGKIRRSARGIRRWMLKKNSTPEIALKAMNRKYNRKFYGKAEKEELSWKYWFFPTITTADSLKIIDQYLQEQERFLVTGKHNQKNYEKVPYEMLKKYGYKSLVNEYYRSKSKNLSFDI